MKTYLTSGMIVILLWLASNSSFAQTPVQWTRTLQFEGNWSGDAELNLGGQLFTVLYFTNFNTTIDGNAMTMDEGFTDPNLGELKGANLIGYSPYDDQIHWFSVDNFGTAHEHTGSWQNPRHFYMEHHSIQNGLPFSEYIDFRLRANNTRMLVTLFTTLGPDTIQTIEGILYRQPDNNRVAGNSSESHDPVLVYPNPSRGTVYIESDAEIDEILIWNEAGQLVSQNYPNIHDYEVTLSKSGMYLIKILSGGIEKREKIFIE